MWNSRELLVANKFQSIWGVKKIEQMATILWPVIMMIISFYYVLLLLMTTIMMAALSRDIDTLAPIKRTIYSQKSSMKVATRPNVTHWASHHWCDTLAPWHVPGVTCQQTTADKHIWDVMEKRGALVVILHGWLTCQPYYYSIRLTVICLRTS